MRTTGTTRRYGRLAAAAIAGVGIGAGSALVADVPAHAQTGGPASSASWWVPTGDGALHGPGGATLRLPAHASQVTMSPNGKLVAYVDGSGALWSARVDGVGGPALLDGASRHTHPTWLSDGSHIITDDGAGRLLSTPAAGGPSTVLPTQIPRYANVRAANPNAGPNDTIVFELTYTSQDGPATALGVLNVATGDIHAVDIDSAQQPTWGFGTLQPTLSPDGSRIAYVCKYDLAQGATPSDWVHEICAVPTNANGAGYTSYFSDVPGPIQGRGDVTYSWPEWSPDGTQVAYDSNASVTVIGQGGTNRQGADLSAQATYRPVWREPSAPVPVTRDAGLDRDATAIAVSQSLWAARGAGGRQAQAAVISRDDLPADALSGSALAAHVGGPLLLTPSSHLNPSVTAELHRILEPGATVYLLGGPSALSPAVRASVTAAGFTPVQLAGENRYATSVDIARQISASGTPDVLLATGQKFPDALAAGAAAGARSNTVVLLTDDNSMPPETAAYLAAHHPAHLWAIGGSAAAAAAGAHLSATPLVGADRYATAALVSHQFFPVPRQTVIATGATWPDALSGGALAASTGSPLLLTDPYALSAPTASALIQSEATVGRATVVGGAGAVSDAVVHQVSAALD